MSKFMVNMTAVNPVDRQRQTPPIEVMVDTGAEFSWLPKKLLLDVGIKAEKRLRFETATREIIERDTGYAFLSTEGHTLLDLIVMAEEGDLSLLGVHTIEGFGVMVDNIGHRFVAHTAFTAPANIVVQV